MPLVYALPFSRIQEEIEGCGLSAVNLSLRGRRGWWDKGLERRDFEMWLGGWMQIWVVRKVTTFRFGFQDGRIDSGEV
jgi:hypothetical protein